MSRKQCLNCDARRGLAEYSNGDYCYSCHKKFRSLNDGLALSVALHPTSAMVLNWRHVYEYEDMPIDCKKFLASVYVLDPIFCFTHFIFYTSEYSRLVFYNKDLKSAWLRSLYPKSKSKWLFVGDKNEPYYWTSVQDTVLETLVVCEDPISAVRISEFKDVVALGGTNFEKQQFTELFLKYKNIIVWLDGDEAGCSAAIKLVKKWGLIRNVRRILTPKDPKCYSPNEMQDLLNV